MQAIIDIDSHFEPGSGWLDPYPELAARLPKLEPARLAVHTIVGDLLRDVPENERPPLADLLPPGLMTLKLCRRGAPIFRIFVVPGRRTNQSPCRL